MPRTEGKGQASFCPFALREISVLTELALGHLRYHLTDVPPQSNSPPRNVLGASPPGLKDRELSLKSATRANSPHRVSRGAISVGVFHWRPKSPPYSTPEMLRHNRRLESICPFALREVSVLTELALGHLRYHLKDVPPQSNSPPHNVLGVNRKGMNSST